METRRFHRKKTPNEKPQINCKNKGCVNPAVATRRDGLCRNCGFFLDEAAKKAQAR